MPKCFHVHHITNYSLVKTQGDLVLIKLTSGIIIYISLFKIWTAVLDIAPHFNMFNNQCRSVAKTNILPVRKAVVLCVCATPHKASHLTAPWKVFTRHRWAVTFTTLHLGLNFQLCSSPWSHRAQSLLVYFKDFLSTLYLLDLRQCVDRKHIGRQK